MAENDSFADFMQRVRAGDGQAAADLVRTYESAIRMEVRMRLSDPRLQRVFDPRATSPGNRRKRNRPAFLEESRPIGLNLGSACATGHGSRSFTRSVAVFAFSSSQHAARMRPARSLP
jgi:hypothetical protein